MRRDQRRVFVIAVIVVLALIAALAVAGSISTSSR
jgi:type II secretory pathway component PulK